MPVTSWSDRENDLIVADYFVMLTAEIAGQQYSKTAHRQSLLPLLNGRSEPSIEFKRRNISGVLQGLGERWITGYRPAMNIQGSLIDAVARWLDAHPDWTLRTPTPADVTEELELRPPPSLRNELPGKDEEELNRIASRFDVAARDDRNRALGRAGEACVLRSERLSLAGRGRPDLAERVRWTSQEDGDGAGYDIASFRPDGRPRLLEVKTTNGWERTPFFISQNELAVADERREEWCLVRLWDFSRRPMAFELVPPLERHLVLTPTAFRASFG